MFFRQFLGLDTFPLNGLATSVGGFISISIYFVLFLAFFGVSTYIFMELVLSLGQWGWPLSIIWITIFSILLCVPVGVIILAGAISSVLMAIVAGILVIIFDIVLCVCALPYNFVFFPLQYIIGFLLTLI